MSRPAPVIAVHGGAGRISEEVLGAEVAARRLATLRAAVASGRDVLAEGGSALHAVCRAVQVLEDDGGFNAGRGAVRTASGRVELDAAVMEGTGRQAGAVCAATGLRNPVLVARQVMEDGRHLLLAGPGADAFAAATGATTVGSDYFVRKKGSNLSPGTVGAVALDAEGRLAAATSTGGTEGQLDGRVGDTPVIGAGTWADDGTCAVSATGRGEAFVRVAFAHQVHARVLWLGQSPAEACDAALADVVRLGGDGGCVAVGADGTVALPFVTVGMARGYARVGEHPTVAIDR